MILLLALLLAGQVSPELRQHVEKGLQAKHSGDLETAAREFSIAAELAPNLAAAHMNLAAVYYDQKDYPRAIPALRRALELNPDLPGAQAMLGSALLALGYAAEALPLLRKTGPAEVLGVALLETGHEREAVDQFEAALTQHPDDPDLQYYLGEAHARLSRQVLGKLVASHPDSARAHQVQAETADREGAERHLRSALASRPDLRGVHLALGELLLSSGDFEGAGKEFREEVRLAPGSAVAAYKLGFVLLNQGQVQEAIAALRRADSLQPGMPETLLELGKAVLAHGDLREAEKLFRKVLEQERTSRLSRDAHFQLAQVYRRQGRATDAARETKLFEDATARKPESRP